MVQVFDKYGRLKVISPSSGGGGVSSVSAILPITSTGGTTPFISTSMATNKLIGRSTAGVGVMEEITIGSGLNLSAGTLTASGAVTPNALTRTNDTNVTLTLGGTPNTALLQATSLTLGWTGTLADSRITSASNWNTAYTNRITSLTTTGSGAATLISNVLNIPTPALTNFVPYTGATSDVNIGTNTISGTDSIILTGFNYDNFFTSNNSTLKAVNIFPDKISLSTNGLGIKGLIKSDLLTTSDKTYQLPNASGTIALTSNIGTWGALNYPTWTTGTPFVKMTAAGTFALDTNTYLTSYTETDPVWTSEKTNYYTKTEADGRYLQSFTETYLGTVTSVSVVSANGFAGTVATSTSTPAITLTTTVTGLLKGNGTAISAAVAGTDYLTSNQTITLSGAVTGSGTTAITTTLANSVVGISNLSATGTASSSTYLRGDNTWATISVGGGYTVTSQTTNYTATATSGTLIVKGDTTGGTFTVTLPTAVGNTSTIIIKKTVGSAALVIDGAGTETIDGGLTASLIKVNESVTLISDNVNWQIV